MNLLLDTHILLWWCLDNGKLSPGQVALLAEEEKRGNPLGVSIFSLWEVAKLVSVGRFHLGISIDQWIRDIEGHASVQLLALNGDIILESTRLGPEFPKDPADQLIAATARCHGLRLMTVDERIANSGVVALA